MLTGATDSNEVFAHELKILEFDNRKTYPLSSGNQSRSATRIEFARAAVRQAGRVARQRGGEGRMEPEAYRAERQGP